MTNSKAWINRHINDPFVQEAQRLGYLSRAVFKLKEIQEKEKIIKPGMVVIDLGAAPGGWSQIASQYVGKKGRVIAVDILPVANLPGVDVIQGDFNDQAVLDEVMAVANGPVDIIISDMAPNLSGQKSIDMPRSVHLQELALDCAERLLKPSGTLLTKAFQGAGLESYVRSLKLAFSCVKYRKPSASRPESKEVYILATGFNRSHIKPESV